MDAKHPSVYQFLTRLKDQQKVAEIKVIKTLSGEKTKKKAKYIALNERLVELVTSYDSNNIVEFLRGCSMNIA